MPLEPEDRMQVLRELGLSEYASRSYLALLELGKSEARDIARLAKVPVAKIYSTLDQLALKGYVVAHPENPRRFAPQPISHVLGLIAQEHEEKAKETRARAVALESSFRMTKMHHASDRGATTVLRGRRNAYAKLHHLAGRANDSLILASDRFWTRSASGKLLSSPRAPRVLSIEDLAGETVFTLPVHVPGRVLANRRGARNPVTMCVFDDDAALLVHHVPDDGRDHDGQDVALLVEEEALVRALRDVLEALWAAQEPASMGNEPLRER